MNEEHELKTVASAARRILDAYGHVETSDSSRVVYTDGDLNIGREGDILEIIYRGSLVLRYDPERTPDDCVFEEHGDWMKTVERMSQAVSTFDPDREQQDKNAER